MTAARGRSPRRAAGHGLSPRVGSGPAAATTLKESATQQCGMSRRRNPFDEVERMLDRLSDQLEGEFGEVGTRSSTVPVDVAERGDEYVVTADLPGFDADDIDVELDEDTLSIEAERETERETETEQYHRRERRREAVRRSVRLPGAVDDERVSASHSNGVLTVRLPKASGDGGRRIEIE